MHETLQQLLEDANYTTRSYSGRGMMGKECLGVVVPDAIHGAYFIGRLVADYNFRAPRYDSMGRDTILYWPKIPYVKESDNERLT